MDQVSFIPIGGIGDVTRNMYLYEYRSQILIVDCGLGFADEAMLGVDLLLPDVSYLTSTKKRIVGMVLTHGHEDHIGALPFILPQLPKIPVYASPLTAAFANEKLAEFGVVTKVNTVPFENNTVSMGPFTCSFIRVTHSVPDTSHIFIKTPAGNFYHGSDYKFDNTPNDGKISDYEKIKSYSYSGVLSLMSDCLGAERKGRTKSESTLLPTLEEEMQRCKGKFIVTTYSSNIARLNQIVAVSQSHGRKICFVGRSLIKTKEVAARLGYLQIKQGVEIEINDLKKYSDNRITLVIAGSQGQENSGMARVANGEHREIKLKNTDTVIFSSDPIPGNELLVYELIDTIAKKGCRVLYSAFKENIHVSGHASQEEMLELISMVRPKHMVPIGGNFRHMAAYANLLESNGFRKHNVFLIEDGQEIIFSQNGAKLGRKIPVKNVYVDEISGGEIEQFVIRDRQKISQEGIVVVMSEIDVETGQIVNKPTIIIRGLPTKDSPLINERVSKELKKALSKNRGRITNVTHIRTVISEICDTAIFRATRRRPLILPVVIEV
ncbi:MAG: ribonuclease J [Candidatus Levybacteria bacterium]|nr:ribonuclease J [Candidatus Levybacteria bacterium]